MTFQELLYDIEKEPGKKSCEDLKRRRKTLPKTKEEEKPEKKEENVPERKKNVPEKEEKNVPEKEEKNVPEKNDKNYLTHRKKLSRTNETILIKSLNIITTNKSVKLNKLKRSKILNKRKGYFKLNPKACLNCRQNSYDSARSQSGLKTLISSSIAYAR